MPTQSLPRDPSFENLKKQAKTLQNGVRAGNADALARVKEFHPRSAGVSAPFALSDAQLVTARQYGFASWPKLKERVETIQRFARSPHKEPATKAADAESLINEFLRLACLNYGNDHVSRRAQARALLAAHPEMARANIYVVATIGDVTTARAMLARHPELAQTQGGPHQWEPLLYACYSRLNSAAAGHATLEVARLLLQHGADPNAGYLWEGTYAFTALTGAFGEGERGPTQQPPHQSSAALARLLLDAGADPNDAQTLYNRHFRPDNEHLKLLLEYGLGKDKGGPWFARTAAYPTNPARLLVEELWAAAVKNYLERVQLLVEHGADVNEAGARDGRTPYEAARRSGNDEVAAYLLAHGARKVTLSPEEEFASACLAGNRVRVEALRKSRPQILEKLSGNDRAGLLVRAAETHKYAGVRLMVELGFDLNGMAPTTALHQAAWAGDLDMVKLLVELGADPGVHESAYNATPLGWAMFNQQAEVVEFLRPRADIFDAVTLDQVERVEALLARTPDLVHARDRQGQTALHWLNANVQRGVQTIGVLLGSGADVNARNGKGETALDKVTASGREDLAKLLRERGAKTGAEVSAAIGKG